MKLLKFYSCCSIVDIFVDKSANQDVEKAAEIRTFQVDESSLKNSHTQSVDCDA